MFLRVFRIPQHIVAPGLSLWPQLSALPRKRSSCFAPLIPLDTCYRLVLTVDLAREAFAGADYSRQRRRQSGPTKVNV